MFCNQCGKIIVPGAKFCSECGAKMENVWNSAANTVAEPAADAVNNITETVSEVAENIAMPVFETADNMTESVMEMTESAAASAVEAAETIAAPVTEAVESVAEPAIEAAEAITAPVTEAVESVAEPAVEAAETIAAPVTETVESVAEQPVFQQPEQPVFQQPSQPVYQQPEQPVYQQPSQPVYQQPSQPVFQQPEQPAYQPLTQPVYRQQIPTKQPKKKKSKAPAIIIGILLTVIVLAGGLIAYLTFFDKNGIKEYIPGIDFNLLDFTQLSDEEEKTFKDLAIIADRAVINQDASKLKRAYPEYALDYILSQFNCSTAQDYVDSYHNEYVTEELGTEIGILETPHLMFKVKDLKELKSVFKTKFDKEVSLKNAYVVENVCRYRNKKDTDKCVRFSDTYLFFETEDGWNIIQLSEDGLSDFGLDK